MKNLLPEGPILLSYGIKSINQTMEDIQKKMEMRSSLINKQQTLLRSTMKILLNTNEEPSEEIDERQVESQRAKLIKVEAIKNKLKLFYGMGIGQYAKHLQTTVFRRQEIYEVTDEISDAIENF